MKVRQLYLPPALEEDALHMEIVQVAGETGTALQYLQEDLTVQFGKSKLQIFAPLSYLPGNDGGLSVLCSQEGYDILVTGDMSIDGEARLLQTHTLPQVELLLAGHHGAATSTGAPLLEAVCPQTVVISVGAENRYGHPAPETLRRLHDAKATVFRTDQAGTVTVRRCG